MNVQGLRGHSLKTRMAISTLAICLLSMWALSYYASTMLRLDMVRISGQQQFSTVSLLADQIDGQVNERLEALKAVAHEVTPGMFAKTEALQKLLQEHPELQLAFNGGVFVAGADGTAIADLPLSAGRVGVNYIDRTSVSTPLRDGIAMVGQPAMGKKLGAPIFSLSAPIQDASGKVLGVLVGTINLGLPNFLDKLMHSPYGKSGGYLLGARDSRLVVTATDKRRVLKPLGNTAISSLHIDGHEGSDVFVNGVGVEVLGSVKGIPVAKWFLAATLPTTEAFAPIREMQQRMLWATLVLSILACGLTWWLLKRELFPVLTTVEKLAMMADENMPLTPLAVPKHTEMGELIIGVNRVLITLESREAALLESESFRRAIIDSVCAQIAVLNRHGVIIAVNRAWLRFSEENRATPGTAAARVGIGINYLDTFRLAVGSPEEVYALRAADGIHRVLDRIVPVFSMEYPCNCPDEQRWFMLVVTPLESPEGGGVVSHNDITARKKAEELTHQSEERLLRMQAGANDAFWDFDLVRNQMFYSLRWWNMLGYAGDQHTNAPDFWRHLLHPDDAPRINKCFNALFVSDINAVCQEFRLQHQDGHYVSIECRGVISRDQNGKAIRISGANTDLTERKLAEGNLLAAKVEAELANRAKSRFLAAASHDLRQPLAALSLYVGVLKERATAQDSSLVSKIEACCLSLTNLLTDLLEVSKLDAGVVAVKASEFAIDALLRSLVTVHSAEANIKGLRLRMRPRPGVMVYSDPTLLARIVGNLIANAIRFTNKGGILVACRHRAGMLSLEVWDTGIGIPADKTEHVFHEFTKLNEAQSNSGSGLGLSIVAKTAALLGLQIRVQSKEGQGSMFAIELPAGRTAAMTASMPYSPETRLL